MEQDAIQYYIKEEHLPDCLIWLRQNTEHHQNNSFNIVIHQQIHKVNGGNIQFFDKDQKPIIQSDIINQDGNFQGFNTLHFTSNLLLQPDLKIINHSIDWTQDWETEHLQNQINSLKSLNLTNNKLSVGHFDISISKLINQAIYSLKVTAPTYSHGSLFTSSKSTQHWIKQLSLNSQSIITYLDLGYKGKQILYYNGIQLDLPLKDEFLKHCSESTLDFFVDYYNIHFHNEYHTNTNNLLQNRTCIVEDNLYLLFIEENKWVVYISNGINFKFTLNDKQINEFQLKGKVYLDEIVYKKTGA